jgi:hypothetical protein
MLFMGWSKTTTKRFGPTVAVNCPNCRNEMWMHLYRHRKWLTLFFIPLIPYRSEHFLLCSVCSHGVPLTGHRIRQAKQLNEWTQSYLKDVIDAPAYRCKVEKIRLQP